MEGTESKIKIEQFFSKDLLSKPFRLGDSLETFVEVLAYIEKKQFKKIRNLPKKRAKCERLREEFLDLYERTKAKKEKLEKVDRNKTQRSFYFLRLPTKSLETVWRRLRRKRIRTTTK